MTTLCTCMKSLMIQVRPRACDGARVITLPPHTGGEVCLSIRAQSSIVAGDSLPLLTWVPILALPPPPAPILPPLPTSRSLADKDKLYMISEFVEGGSVMPDARCVPVHSESTPPPHTHAHACLPIPHHMDPRVGCVARDGGVCTLSSTSGREPPWTRRTQDTSSVSW
jgi:hypothetical protein